MTKPVLWSPKEAALGVQQQNEKSARSSIIEANSGVVAAQANLARLKKEFERYPRSIKRWRNYPTKFWKGFSLNI